MTIKGCNSVANLQKTMIYFTNVDLVNDYVYTKFGLNHSILFQDNEQNSILTLIKGCNSVANLPKSNSSKLSCMSSLPARMKKIQLKMKVLDCSQDISHYKSMGIFSRRSRAANSAVHSPIWLNFELI